MYVSPNVILWMVCYVTYELEFPSSLGSIHSVFHVSRLREFLHDPFLVVSMEWLDILNSLSYKEITIEILDRQVCRLRTKDVASVKVL